MAHRTADRIKNNIQRSDPNHRIRADIQGLRMIAVITVILNHLFHWPVGGFLGVDVFFVISGFLITSLLLREHARTGTISFLDFYRRRVKRILPAAIIVVTVTVVVAWFLYAPARFRSTVVDGFFSTFFTANWRFAIRGTDYFLADAATSPLQHYWSLAVEEQFYLLWPWLMLFLLGLISVRKGNVKQRELVVFGAVALVSLASFLWALWETSNAPTWAYFSTFSRAWELGIGAMLATLAGQFSEMRTLTRTILAWLGLVGILISVLIIDPDRVAFPAPWGFLPVLSTSLVVISGTGGSARFIWPINNKLSSYVGDISFSLYLWHFPVIIFLAPLFAIKGLLYYSVLVSVIFGLSILSYHFIEDPLRKWTPSRHRVASRLNAPKGLARLAGIKTPVFIASTMLVFGFGVGGFYFQHLKTAPAIPLPSVETILNQNDSPTLTERQLEVRSALDSHEWPMVEPGWEVSATDAYVPEWTVHGCLTVTDENLQDCSFGPENHTGYVAVVGDSTATSLLPMLKAAFPDKKIQALTRGECPAADVDVVRISGESFPECNEHREWAENWVERHNPDIVVLADVSTTLGRFANGLDAESNVSLYAEGLSRTLSQLTPFASKVVVTHSPPLSQNLDRCKSPVLGPSACIAQVSDLYGEWSAVVTMTSNSVAWQNVVNVPVEKWFCLEGVCPAFIGNERTFAGGAHLTEHSSRASASLFLEALEPLKGA